MVAIFTASQNSLVEILDMGKRWYSTTEQRRQVLENKGYTYGSIRGGCKLY